MLSDNKFETTLVLPAGTNLLLEGGLRTKGLFKKHEANRPLVTVITVVFNGADDLEKTLLSVLNQSYDNVEYIVIDGGSTDGTLDIIRQYDHVIDYWLSEKDVGIYHAMNKGIQLANGDWLNFMNSGDYFHENSTLDKIAIQMASNMAIIFGDFETFSNRHQFYERKVPGPVSVKNLVMKMPICHQSMFVTLQSFKYVGLFDTNYKLCADHDWLIKALLAGQQAKYVKECIAFSNIDGVSSTSIFQRKRERLAIALVHFDGLKLKIYLMALVSFIKAPFTFCLFKLKLIGVGRRYRSIKKI